MPRDASGDVTFTPSSVNPAVPQTSISSADHNALLAEIIEVETDSLSRTGLGGMLADLDMGANQITDLGAPAASTDAATKGYVDTGDAAVAATVTTLDGNALKKDGSVALTGDLSAGTHKITNLASPTASTDAASKGYADAIAGSANTHVEVRAATITAGTLASSFENGDTIDAVVLATGDRILIKDQASAIENGIYTVNASGAPTRATDMAAASVAVGLVPVKAGTGGSNANKAFAVTVPSPVVGTDAIVFTAYPVPGTYSGSAGVSISGSTVSLDLTYAAAWTAAQSITITTAATALALNSTEAGNLPGPILDLYRNSASPAASDFLSEIRFAGNSSTGTKRTYADIFTFVTDPTNASEDAQLIFGTYVAGVQASRLTIGAGVFTPNATDKGAGTIHAGTALYENGVLIPDIPYLETSTLGTSVTKTAARVATTASAAFATAFANGQTIDGIVLATGNRLLIKDQIFSAGVSDPAQNGVWLVPASGAPTTRVTDMDTSAEMLNAIVPVTLGTTNAGTSWLCSTPGTMTLGTDSNPVTNPPPTTATQISFVSYPSTSTTTRSNRQNRSNTVWAEEWGLDNTGASATAHTAIQRAVLEAFARERSEIRLPPGKLNFGGTLTVINENTKRKIRLIGSGRGTQIYKSTGTGTWIQIGQNLNEGKTGALRTGGVNFESIDFVPNSVMTADEVVNCKFVKDISFRDCHFGESGTLGVYKAFSLGVGASAVNNVIFMDLESCPIISNGSSGVAVIQLGSGGSLNIKGSGRNDGNDGSYYIQHADTTWNWDGLYVYDLFAAGFERYIDSVGAGLGNMIWANGQADGAAVGFNAAATTGDNDKWDIHGVQMLNGTTVSDPTPTRPLIWTNASGGKSAALKFCNNRVEHYSTSMQIISTVADGGVAVAALIEGNTFGGCGWDATEIIRWGDAGKTTRGIVVGNSSYLRTGFTANAFGMRWAGTSDTTNRVYANNLWMGTGGALIGDTGTR